MNEDLKRWDEIAPEWVTEVIPKGLISEHLTKPAFVELLGAISGKKILDAGCGNGRYSKFLAALGANVTGVDGSYKMIEFAKAQNPDLQFVVSDLTQSWPFDSNSFDVVVSEAVLMSLSDISRFLSEAHRVLTGPGTMVISVLHPAFNEPTLKLHKSWLDKLMLRKVTGRVYDYYQKMTVRKDDNATKGLNFYHRTIQEYTEEFRKAGFLLERILEPRVTDSEYLNQNPKIEYAARMPRFIFFKLIKQ